MDCHGGWTAIAAVYRKEGRGINTEPPIWYATASLNVKYLHPTPMDEAVVLHARVKETTGKKTIVTCSLFAKGEEYAFEKSWRCGFPNGFGTKYEYEKRPLHMED
jgi:acyl-coenzyme A thioesterase PaaI-like protein